MLKLHQVAWLGAVHVLGLASAYKSTNNKRYNTIYDMGYSGYAGGPVHNNKHTVINIIGVVDVAYGANSTLPKLAGIPPLAINGFWNYITAKYYPYTDSNININPEYHEQLLIVV